ncbi:MAG: ATP-binding protein [Thermoprotei archaeon]|nr:MAG: ATP-binding protein [Thermoprotei archaeon]
MSSKSMISPLEAMRAMIKKRMSNVRHKLAIISGKGGVGKSFVAASLALSLKKRGREVAILDADIHGPSIPKIMGIRGASMYVNPQGDLLPVISPSGVAVISIELLMTNPDLPVIWRGPLKGRAISEFLSKVSWGELDYLIIDLPPGTGDEALTVGQILPDLSGAIIVTAPSDLSKIVVKKAAIFCRELGIRILGIVENMSEFTCPRCGATYKLFGSGVGESMAKELGVEFLGSIPLDPRISEAMDRGELHKVLELSPIIAKSITKITEKVEEVLEKV